MDNLFDLVLASQQQLEQKKLLSCNEKTAVYGLILSEKDAALLMAGRKNTLKENERVEFGGGILPEIIYAFCDSSYLNPENYVEVLNQLQEIFYLYKNECMEELNDNELISFMRKQFDDICFGDLEYLSGTCLERFSRAIRSGYRSSMQQRLRDEYTLRDTENEYEQWDEEARWEFELYRQTLENMD